MPDPRGPLGALLDRLARPSLGEVPDGELLARFARHGDQAAFAELVRRHGAMVHGVARRLAPADAEDVAQAAFVVLARRAAEFGGRGTVGDFLHGVARRLALKARSAAARRLAVERRAARSEVAATVREADAGFDADRLLAGLPAKYRAAVILCDLEGVSRRDAALRMGVPEGTVSSRLDAAHRLLAARLSRLGVKLSVAAVLAVAATSGAPAGLVSAATAVALVSVGHGAGTVPAAVLALAAKLALAIAAAIAAVGLTAVGVAQTGGKANEPAKVEPAEPTPDNRVPQSLATPTEAVAARRALATKEAASLTRGFWRVKSKTVNGRPVDLNVTADVFDLALGKVRPPGETILTDAPDAAQVFLSAPQFNGDTEIKERVAAFKLNPHRTPRELTLVRTQFGRPDAPTNVPAPLPAPSGSSPPPPVAQFDFYLACIYELDGDILRLARYEGYGEADRPRGFTPEEQPPGAPDLIVLEFSRIEPEPKK